MVLKVHEVLGALGVRAATWGWLVTVSTPAPTSA